MWYMYCKLGPIYFHWVVRQIASDPKGWLAASKRMPVHMAVATWCMNSAAMDVRMLCFQGVLGFAARISAPWAQLFSPPHGCSPGIVFPASAAPLGDPGAVLLLKVLSRPPVPSLSPRQNSGLGAALNNSPSMTYDDMDGWASVKGKWWKMMINHGMVILNLGWCVSMSKSVSAKDLHILSAKMAKLSQAAGHDCLTICSKLLQAMPSGKSADPPVVDQWATHPTKMNEHHWGLSAGVHDTIYI